VRQTYFVPVRESQAGTLALRTGRLVSGECVGLAFTSEASLLVTMGPFQHWVRLAAEPLRDMLAPLGVQCVRIDPRPTDELRPGGLPQRRATGDVEPRAAQTPCVHRARRHGRSHGCHAAHRCPPSRRAGGLNHISHVVPADPAEREPSAMPANQMIREEP
jgi:hypothetical protein